MTDDPPALAEQPHPLIRRLLAPNPSPFTWQGTQTYIVGRGEVAVIDPGPDIPEHVEALIDAVAGEKVAAILCTHTHRDHSPASRPLHAATGAPVIGCAPLVLSDKGPRADLGFDAEYQPHHVLADGALVSADGWTIEAVATPGHTSNHLCFALREAKALFTGDHVMGWSTTVVAPPDGDMAAYMASLGKLLERDEEIYFPTHGPPIEEPRRFVARLIGHRRLRERQILRQLEAGEGSIPQIVGRLYVGLDERLLEAAGRSVLAHLIDLERRGKVVKGRTRWRLRD
ncbi:MAG: MBL fold metallo-hydrolase [Sphingomonadales bacterium]